MNEVQKIECRNLAAFVMSFKVKSATHASDATENYPVLQSKYIDLAGAGFTEGDDVWPQVSAVWGKTISSDGHVTFKKNGKKAIYEVHGTTLKYTVDFKGIVDDSGSTLPDFPADIPVAQMPFQNWALAINAASVWTATPSSAADMVTICNWAVKYGYTVRATGIKHTWSPITIPDNLPATAKVLLVDTSKLNGFTMIPAANGTPAMVRVGTGATMGELLAYLQTQTGNGVAPGYSFANVPAPEHLTVGGVLAINGHGTSVPTPPNDAFSIGYGSMSNNILELTAVVTDSGDSEISGYQLKTFKRGEEDTKALLTHLGRTLIVEVVLLVIDNYNLRCQSFMNVSAATLFATQTGDTAPAQSLSAYLEQSGRVEAIWFPFTSNPWLKVWTVEAEQPAGSVKTDKPNNYPFSDNVGEEVTAMIKVITGLFPELTPKFGQLMYTITTIGLGIDKAYDLWGASRNTLFYVKDTTLRVTANGYAVLMKKEYVQNAVAAFATKFEQMLNAYAVAGKYPINSPLEIRITGLDSPDTVPVPNAGRPVISSLSVDEETIANGWDVALWLDVLTLPGTKYSDEFYAELEEWFIATYTGATARVVPEWSKGWAYTSDKGPWTNAAFMKRIGDTFMGQRSADDNWNYEVNTLAKYDRHGLFTNPLLGELFQTV